MSPFRLVFRKAYHLQLEFEHIALWATGKLNFDLSIAGEERKLQSNELGELRHFSYKNAKLYKKNTKRWHENMIRPKDLNPIY